MNAESAIKWEPAEGILWPCADISFSRQEADTVSVTMHFSRVLDGSPRDLLLMFTGAIALRWESESSGSYPLPPSPPRCPDPWSRWIFPLIRVEHSAWFSEVESQNPPAAAGRAHFWLISMNDLVHVLARPEVSARWLSPTPEA